MGLMDGFFESKASLRARFFWKTTLVVLGIWGNIQGFAKIGSDFHNGVRVQGMLIFVGIGLSTLLVDIIRLTWRSIYHDVCRVISSYI